MKTRTSFVVAVLLFATLLPGCASGPAAEPAPTPTDERMSFEEALIRCGSGRADEATVLDDGASLDLDAVGQTNRSMMQFTHVECLLDELGAPAALAAKISQTRALDGRQEDAWDGYSISWTYHPDDGLNAVIEQDD